MKDKNLSPEIEELFTHPEAWDPWESKLVIGSIVLAIIGLTILGILINVFILK